MHEVYDTVTNQTRLVPTPCGSPRDSKCPPCAAKNRRLRMQQLALKAVLSRTQVSRIVTELEGAELVERIPDPADGRATLAHITPKGRQALRLAAPVYLAGIERHCTRHLTAR